MVGYPTSFAKMDGHLGLRSISQGPNAGTTYYLDLQGDSISYKSLSKQSTSSQMSIKEMTITGPSISPTRLLEENHDSFHVSNTPGVCCRPSTNQLMKGWFGGSLGQVPFREFGRSLRNIHDNGINGSLPATLEAVEELSYYSAGRFCKSTVGPLKI